MMAYITDAFAWLGLYELSYYYHERGGIRFAWYWNGYVILTNLSSLTAQEVVKITFPFQWG